ncbi:uncharacterized protein LOC124170015 [Ischnura elegans]|uniref:uncharacterized protein LOC124170015 n=1 Tax=Ischnura elegans TaxID=197161 RepID=UPI001ED869FD|nr:uncharacterized protein LOC124170015 [Ischnura elegans]
MYDTYSDPLCRLCLANDGHMVYVFDPKGYNGYRVWEIIWELLQLEVSKEDGLPGTICQECLEKVTEFKNFKTVCIQAKISILKEIASRGIVDGSSGFQRNETFLQKESVLPLLSPAAEDDDESSDEPQLVEVVTKSGSAKRRMGKRLKGKRGSKLSAAERQMKAKDARLHSKLSSGGEREPEVVEIIEDDAVEEGSVVCGAAKESRQNKDEKHSVESTGTCQVRKDDRHGNGKKGRSEDRHSSGGKAVERSSDVHKPRGDDGPSKTSAFPKEKTKIRDKKDGPSTTGHAQRDDDRRASRTETSLAGVAKLAEESGRNKEGHASKTTASASAKERGKASERRGRNKDEKHSVESTGTCQVRKDDRHGNGKKGRSEDRHSSGGKALERLSDAHKSRGDDGPSKTSSLPKEKAKVNDKKQQLSTCKICVECDTPEATEGDELRVGKMRLLIGRSCA